MFCVMCSFCFFSVVKLLVLTFLLTVILSSFLLNINFLTSLALCINHAFIFRNTGVELYIYYFLSSFFINLMFISHTDLFSIVGFVLVFVCL